MDDKPRVEAMSAADWHVESPPPPEPSSTPPDASSVPPVGEAAPSAGPSPLPSDWTEADVAALLEFVRGPYDKLATVLDDESYKLSRVDEMLLVSTLTTWMPPSWIRAGAKGELPLVVGLAVTAVALGAVNLPKLAYWNRTHPDARIAIPFITKRGGRNDRSRPAPSAPAARDGRDQLDGRPSDSGEGAFDGAAGVPADGAPAQFPSADTADDIRRGYEARR